MRECSYYAVLAIVDITAITADSIWVKRKTAYSLLRFEYAVAIQFDPMIILV